MSYGLGFTLEPSLRPLLPSDRTLPLLWFGVYDTAPIKLDHVQAAALWPHERVYAALLKFEWSRATYRNRFDAIMASIRAGDIYEANLSMRAHFKLTGDARALYGRLRERAKVPHGAFVDDGEQQLLSFSPESFFAVGATKRIITRPMKGTAPRDPNPAIDYALCSGLHASGYCGMLNP